MEQTSQIMEQSIVSAERSTERSETNVGNTETNTEFSIRRVTLVVNVPVTVDILVTSRTTAEAVEKAKNRPITCNPKAVRHWDLADKLALVRVVNTETGEAEDISGLEISKLWDVVSSAERS